MSDVAEKERLLRFVPLDSHSEITALQSDLHST